MNVSDDLLVLLAHFILAVVFSYRIYAIVKNVQEIFSPRTIIAAGMFFIYVTSYYLLDVEVLRSYLSFNGYVLLLWCAIFSLIFFYIGFYIYSNKTIYKNYIITDNNKLCWLSLAIVCVALITWFWFLARSGGVGIFYSVTHGYAGDWLGTSAYVYQARYFVFPAILIWMSLLIKGNLKGLWVPLMITVVLLVIADAWLMGRRGYFIRLFIMLILPYVIIKLRNNKMNHKIILMSFLMILIISIIPNVRHATHLLSEHSLVESISDAIKDPNTYAGSSHERGNELLVASALTDSIYKADNYDWGERWVYPFIAFIPRVIWPDKPFYSDFGYQYSDLVWQYQKWIVSGGAATTGVVDSFARFGWLSPILWLFFGYWGARLWYNAKIYQSEIMIAYLGVYLVGLIYFITQAFNGAFYAWFIMVVPVWIISLLSTDGKIKINNVLRYFIRR